MIRTPTSVDVWPAPHCNTRYSISLGDDDGEIRCLGGSNNLEDAWEDACEAAREHGVPARILTAGDCVMREWSPESIPK